jgi:hypothetical protein
MGPRRGGQAVASTAYGREAGDGDGSWGTLLRRVYNLYNYTKNFIKVKCKNQSRVLKVEIGSTE